MKPFGPASRAIALLLGVGCGASPAPVPPPTVAAPLEDVDRSTVETGVPPSAAPPAADAGAAFSVPAGRAGANGWTEYVEPPLYDPSAVAGVAPGGDSPEAAVVHYLASRVRGDSRFQEVMVRECENECARGLGKHAEWTFLRFRLVARKDAGAGELWIKEIGRAHV
jgi:hypothetical protein